MVLTLVAFVISSLAGYAAGYLLPAGPWTPYVPLMVSYHLFLGFLLADLALGGEQKVGLSMPIPMALITHLACLGTLIGVVVGRHYVPYFSLLRYVIPAIAPFEAKWVFEGRRKPQEAPPPKPMPEGTDQDYVEFLQYLRQKDRKFARPGRTVTDEYAAWLGERAKRRTAAQSTMGMEGGD